MNWRDRLRAIRDRLSGQGTSIRSASATADTDTRRTNKTPPPPASRSDEREQSAKVTGPLSRSGVFEPTQTVSQAPSIGAVSRRARSSVQGIQRKIAINLGIDFGTSFTKVSFRDVGTEESGVVSLGAQTGEPLLPSSVAIDHSGRLHLADNLDNVKSPVLVTYLKMRLANDPIGERLPFFEDLDLNDAGCVRALSAWFLATVIIRSRGWLARNESDRLKNRRPIWSANIGVPVEHFDSEVLAVFQDVLGVAWLWVRDGQLPPTLHEAVILYEDTARRLVDEVTDFHAIPEIAAAVQSFVMSREAVPGIYVYFDVGGGTVDGVAFNYRNLGGERHIDFYSGKVAPLGISAIAAMVNCSRPDQIDAIALEALVHQASAAKTKDIVHRVRQHVAKVVMTAKSKDGRDWQQDAFQNADYHRKFIGRLSPSRMRPLVVFMGGGGAKSDWYQRAISSTYEAFGHHNAGIPPYKLVEVPKPRDFTMSGLGNDAFIRFAIAYGLSIPFGEGPEIGLPSQFAEAEKPKRWTPPFGDYADSKDAYD